MNKSLQNTQRESDTVDPFGTNAAAAIAYKKAEKLMTATYLITNHIHESEPLRRSIRDIANNFLANTLKLRDGFTSSGKDLVGTIRAQVRLLLSSLDTLSASQLISDINLRVIKTAYIDFANSLEAMQGASVAESLELTEEYFMSIPHAESAPSLHALPPTKRLKNNEKRDKRQTQKSSATLIKKREKMGGKMPSVFVKQPSQGVAKAATHRSESIIDLLKKRGEAGMPSILEVVTGCSSKTVQRDLANLIKRGVITRNGSKRWAKYSLVSEL